MSVFNKRGLFLIIIITSVCASIQDGPVTKGVFTISNDYLIGQTMDFWVQDLWKAYNDVDDDNDGIKDFSDNDYDESIYSITCEVVNITENGVFFIDQSLSTTYYRERIKDLGISFKESFFILQSTFRNFPDINGDNSIIIVLTDIKDEAYYMGGYGTSVLGFFWPVHSTQKKSTGIGSYSHEAEIIYLDIDTITPNVELGAEILSHELQHLLQFNANPYQDLWLDEGLSVYSEKLCGFDDQIDEYREAYFNNPKKSLIFFDQSLENYGFSSLFVQYIAEKYGLNALSSLYNSGEVGVYAILNSLLNEGYSVSFSDLFINFSIALVLQDENNDQFNFNESLHTFPIIKNVYDYPVINTWTLPSYSFDIYNIQAIPSSKVCRIVFDSFQNEDSRGQNAYLYVALVEIDSGGNIQINRWFIDPITCDNEFLISFHENISRRYLFITSFAGDSGGPLPSHDVPFLNGSFTLLPFNEFDEFIFPGYITIETSASGEKELYASGIRYYKKPSYQFIGSNTAIAKWRLYGVNDGYESTGFTGDLVWGSEAGWFAYFLSTEVINSGSYIFEFEFFDGEETKSFFSNEFSINKSNETGVDLILVGLFGIFIFIGVGMFFGARRIYLSNKYQALNQEGVEKKGGEIKLTKLEPMFYGKEQTPPRIRRRRTKI